MSELLAVTEEVLLLAGAEVEALDCERLDVLLPRDLQTKLSLTELAHLGVSEAANTTVVSLTSDWIERLSSVLGTLGDYAELGLDSWPSRGKAIAGATALEIVKKKLILDNSTFRFNTCEQDLAHYLVVVARGTVEGRDIREQLYVVMQNELSSFINLGIDRNLVDILKNCTNKEAPPLCNLSERVEKLLEGFVATAVSKANKEFIKYSEERYQRDLLRIENYHDSLVQQLAVRESSGKLTADAARVKRQATEQAAKFKRTELSRTSSLKISAVAEQVMRISMPVVRINLELRRRKASRNLVLDFNLFTNQLDTPTCAMCGALSHSFSCDDDNLNLLCGVCLGLAQ